MAISEVIKRTAHFFTRQEKSFKVNLVRQAAQNFLISLTQSYQSIYTAALGATPVQLGLVNSVGGIAGSIISPITGWLADRHGIKRIFTLATPLIALGALLFTVAHDWVMIIPAMFIATLALRMMMTACPMVCGSCLQNAERATGMQFCDTLSAVPRLIAPFLGAVLITVFGGLNVAGIRPLYALQCIGFILVLVFIIRQFIDPARKRDAQRRANLLDDMQGVLNQGPAVRRWILYICVSTIPMYVAPVYLPLYVAQVKTADQYVISAIALTSTIVPLLLSLPTGRLADTFGRKRVIYLLTPLYCVSFLLLIMAPNASILIASGVFQGFFTLAGVTQAALAAELVPTAWLGRWYGALGLFRGIVSVVTPAIGGLIWNLAGPNYVFVFLAGTQVLKLLILTTIPETLKRKLR
jgi:MFS family permease